MIFSDLKFYVSVNSRLPLQVSIIVEESYVLSRMGRMVCKIEAENENVTELMTGVRYVSWQQQQPTGIYTLISKFSANDTHILEFESIARRKVDGVDAPQLVKRPEDPYYETNHTVVFAVMDARYIGNYTCSVTYEEEVYQSEPALVFTRSK